MNVYVAADLEPLIPNFLRNRHADAERIRVALTDGDVAAVARLGHRMKGNGASFGFDVISSAGDALQDAAGANDIDAIAVAVAQLE